MSCSGRVSCVVLAVATTLSCAGGKPVADAPRKSVRDLVEPSTPAAQPAFVPPFGGAPLERVSSRRLAVTVMLPDRVSWKLNDVAEQWLRGVHSRSGSRIAVRAWRAESLCTPADCERQARSWRPGIPLRHDSLLVSEDVVDTTAGYQMNVTVGFSRLESSEPEGFVLGFGANLRLCVAVAYFVTLPGGLGDERAQEVALGRMGFVAERVAPTVSALSVDSRVQRQRGP